METESKSYPWYTSLYLRIAAFFFVTLFLLGVAYLIIDVITARRYYDETTQRVNAPVAAHMLLEVNPFVDGKVQDDAIGKIMHSMMAVNPGLEVYLLDPNGKILSFVVLKEKVKLEQVSLEPIKEFLRTEGQHLVYGDDPKNPGVQKTFSASASFDDQNRLQGYVYMVLASEKVDTIAETIRESYLLKMGIGYFLLTLIIAFLLGLFVFWKLMKGLREAMSVITRFEAGDMQARIPRQSTKELSIVGDTFNTMAGTLLRNVEDLKQVDTLRRELIANVSHDIRTPIAVIQGYIETLIIKENSLDGEKKEEYMKLILKSTDRLKRLVADLFELSKLEARQVQPKREVFIMAILLLEVAQKYALLAHAKNIEIESKIGSPLPMVYADMAMIERVLQNLMDNALKFTPHQGKITIYLTEVNDQIEIKIENSGEGIPQESVSKIFDRYYKIPNETPAESTGLGLAIVKNILQIHQTDIHVMSKRFGLTAFSFRLPMHTA
ncbi:MAG: HAMP domain-containing histidine kinase [Cyclobacteriaceae bacterium]|nr:HAMP domain-containing histidine kinase [Cyclobacteriaceae bacterium]